MKRPRLHPSQLCGFALVGTLHAGQAHGFCFEQAEAKTGLPASLLQAIAKVESNMNPRAINKSHEQRTGTVDLGLMQINSGNLGWLQKQGITRDGLLNDPCLNTMVGASILAEKVGRHGFDWNAIGAYNASCTQLKGLDCSNARNTYANRVYRALKPTSLDTSSRHGPNGSQQPPVRRPSIKTIELEEPSTVAEAN